LPDIHELTADEFQKYAELLSGELELTLIKKLADFPSEIKFAAENFAPYRITVYSLELASTFHSFYNKCRVLTEDEILTSARLLLVMATRQVIKNALSILGISAPDRM